MKIAIKRQIQMPSTFSGKQLNTESDKEKEKKWQKKRHEKNREKKSTKTTIPARNVWPYLVRIGLKLNNTQ